MKNDAQISTIIEKIKYCTKEYLCLPNVCAYSDSVAERIVAYGRELEQLIEEGFNDG